MTKDDIQTGILRVCKVANWDGDFNVVGFHALCDALVQIGAAEEREENAKLCNSLARWHGQLVTAAFDHAADSIRARGEDE